MIIQRHHIIPTHVTGGIANNDPANLFDLSFTQHALAHRNLGILRNSPKDWQVWLLMSAQIGKEEARVLILKLPETRKRMSEAHKGNRHSPETLRKMSISRRLRTQPKHSQEARAKIRAARIGKKHSAETRAKMSASRLNRFN